MSDKTQQTYGIYKSHTNNSKRMTVNKTFHLVYKPTKRKISQRYCWFIENPKHYFGYVVVSYLQESVTSHQPCRANSVIEEVWKLSTFAHHCQ